MSLTSVLDRVLGIVRAVDGLGETNAMVDDWGALDARGTEVAAVVQQGDTSRYGPEVATSWAGSYGTQGDDAALHVVSITVCARRGQGRGGDAAALAALHALVDAVVDAIRAQPTLGDLAGVEAAQVVSVGRPGQLVRPSTQAGAQAAGAALGKVITVQVLEAL